MKFELKKKILNLKNLVKYGTSSLSFCFYSFSMENNKNLNIEESYLNGISDLEEKNDDFSFAKDKLEEKFMEFFEDEREFNDTEIEKNEEYSLSIRCILCEK